MNKSQMVLTFIIVALPNLSLYSMEKREKPEIITLYTETQIKEIKCPCELERQDTPAPQKLVRKQTTNTITPLDQPTPKKSSCCLPCRTYCDVYSHCCGAVCCSKHDSLVLRIFLGCIISAHACITCTKETCCNCATNQQ